MLEEEQGIAKRPHELWNVHPEAEGWEEEPDGYHQEDGGEPVSDKADAQEWGAGATDTDPRADVRPSDQQGKPLIGAQLLYANELVRHFP